MKPEDVERLLERFEPAPPPERLERRVLADAGRPARRWGLVGVVAACLTLSVLLWRVLVPHPDWVPCGSDAPLELHLDASAAARPPAFPTVGPSMEAYADLFRRADAVKPTAEELRWQDIPWITDFPEAYRLARAERRPLFVWIGSDDPLDRCCNCAAGLRTGPLSHEEIVRRVSNGFVPVALNRKVLNAELLRSLQRQKSQYHGIWIVSPEGTVLAGHEKRTTHDAAGWNREILETIDAGLKAFGPVPPRAAPRVEQRPFRGAGVPPDGRVSLALYARLMHGENRDGPITFDTLILEPQEWAAFVPTAGDEWILPEALARKFSRLVSPVSDPDLTPRPEHAQTAELRARVVSADAATATIRLSGRWETAHATSDGKPARGSATGEGVAVFDVREKKMRSFLLVTTGTFSCDASAPRQAAAVLEWSSK